jgi:hypothetical protein
MFALMISHDFNSLDNCAVARAWIRYSGYGADYN